ncbi:VWA domain-containing protein [Celerinatantimonas yamalensis]|uniref:TadE/TadG family type IV pilus assembly protein n=1 Tax=Celerinatantimonas yamalensis TaxID=559956 RepID=A0ABW9G2P5_9GAMM
MKYVHSQKGIASIIFVLIFPFFLGFFALAIEGTRYMTDSARLSDVLESASLAVAASVNHDDDKTMVQDYIAATVPHADVKPSDITITSKTCEQIYGSDCGKAGVYDKNGLQFNEYKVQVNSHFVSWFPGSTLVAGFNKNQILSNQAVARKYQQNFVDIAFVTDFSGSMLDNFGGQNKAKYAADIDIISSIMNTLKSYNDLAQNSNKTERNNVAIVPYSQYNKKIDGNVISEVSYGYQSWGSASVTGPSQVDTISPSFAATELYDSGFNLHQYYPNGVPELNSAEPDGTLIQKYFGWSRGFSAQHTYCSGWQCYYDDYNWDYDDWDYHSHSYSYYYNDYDIYQFWNVWYPDKRDLNYKIRNYIGCSNLNWYGTCQFTGYFFNIGLTDDFSGIEEKIDNFFPSGSTSSSQGIIPAAEMLLNKTSTNTNNLIIVLSDGNDTDNNLSLGYYNSGLCDYLRNQFKSKNQSLKIAVIGFDYDVSKNPGLAECADSKNIFNAQNYDEIYTKILSLITEEIGHLYNHDYKVNN